MPADHVSDHEAFPAELRRMLETARCELDRHTPDRGRCMACGLLWPCPRAELAALALEAV
jgi:hypothetical protein